MRFEVRYASGETHEVVLEGTVAAVGRDPASDIVLNDPKCSRRHAVVEAGPSGMAVRDAGSANGIFVNGRKVDRAQLAPGDDVRLGETHLVVLAEDFPGTVVMDSPEEVLQVDELPPPEVPPEPLPPRRSGPIPRVQQPPPPPPELRPTGTLKPVRTPDFAQDASTRPAPVPAYPEPPAPPPPPPRSARSAPPAPSPPPASRPPAARPPVSPPLARRSRRQRPLTVGTLAVLWSVATPAFLLTGLGLVRILGSTGTETALLLASSGLLALLSGALAFGLWTGAAWAWALQLAVAGAGVLVCPFSLAAVTVLAYLLRPAARAHFVGGPAAPEPEEAWEGLFTAVVVFAVLLGLLATAGGFWLAPRLTGKPVFPARPAPAAPAAPAPVPDAPSR